MSVYSAETNTTEIFAWNSVVRAVVAEDQWSNFTITNYRINMKKFIYTVRQNGNIIREFTHVTMMNYSNLHIFACFGKNPSPAQIDRLEYSIEDLPDRVSGKFPNLQ